MESTELEMSLSELLPANAFPKLTTLIKKLLPILDKRAVILLTGDGLEAESYISQIDALLIRESPIVADDDFISGMDGLFLQKISHRLVSGVTDIENAAAQADVAVMPILPRGTLAKIAVGIQDTPVTIGVAAALMHGTRVIAAKDFYHPGGSLSTARGFDRNNAYNAMLLQHEKTLEGFGVTFTEAKSLSQLLVHFLYPCMSGAAIMPNRILTFEDVRGLPNGGSIEIGSHTRFTSLAQEHIAQRNIRVVRPNAGQSAGRP